MLLKKAPDIRVSEITDKKLYLRRREFIQIMAAAAAGAVTDLAAASSARAPSWPRVKIPGPIHDSGWGRGETLTPYTDITTYNNFQEFGSEKEDPAANAHTLQTRPWTVKIDGLVS